MQINIKNPGFWSLIIMLCSSITATATTAIDSCGPSDMDPAFVTFMQDYDALQQGQFVQVKTMHKYNAAIKTSGQFSLSENQLVWQTEKPQQSKVTLSETSIETHVNGKLMKTPMDQDSFGAVLFTMMKGIFNLNMQSLASEFHLKPVLTNENWFVTLIPCGQLQSEIQKIELELNGVSPSVNVDIFKKNQDDIKLELRPL